MHKQLETANLHWRNANTPISGYFDDIYFSKENGFAESQFVYLDNNDLTERFSELESPHFTIAETGFGTGLNFLLTWQLWRQTASNNKKLYYISTECFPLKREDLQKSLACWPSLSHLSQLLCDNYPPPLSGLHYIELDDSVTLVLLLGDATESLQLLLENSHPQLQYAHSRAVDAWFLDGFAPDKNPQMWTSALFHTIAKLSKFDTTLASFTAAGIVRRGLQAAGFEIEKVKGFGKKREMIRGRFKGLPLAAQDSEPSLRSRNYQPFWPIYRQAKKPKNAIIIGAGIAGITTALMLARSGIKVTVIDKHAEPMQGASGNPQAMLFPKFSFETGTFSQFNLHAYLHALRFYRHYFAEAFNACGMLQILDEQTLLHAQKTMACFSKLPTLIDLIDAEKASELAGTLINTSCLWFSSSGWLKPALIRHKILNEKNITFYGNTGIHTISNEKNQWHAQCDNGTIFSADNIILCNAQSAQDLLQDTHIKTKTIRGQITQFDHSGFPDIKTIICHDGYIAPKDPQQNKHYTCGATYEIKSREKALLISSQQENLMTLAKHLPDFSNVENSPNPLKGRAEFRCSTHDYLPVVGPIANTLSFIDRYRDYAKNSRAFIPQMGIYHQGLFINIAHGSRGFSTAPVAAALIRSYVLEAPFPMPYSLITELHPARFLIRDIIRRKIQH